MLTLRPKYLALAAGLALTASAALAQDSKALIDALVKKGVLTNEEAAQITTEVKNSEAAQDVSTSGGKFLKKLTISGRIQAQLFDLGTSVSGPGISYDQPANVHFALRRIYVGLKADLGSGFTGNFNYDFANDSFDQAFIEWKQSDAFFVDVGLRKAPFAYEETTSSGVLKAIERSPATRYFVEGPNNQLQGAASYRQGVFVGGKQGIFFYNAAATNPERNEFSGGSAVQGAGSAKTNKLALYANAGIADKFEGGTYTVGVATGYLPDQGGRTDKPFNGSIEEYDAYADVTAGGFNVLAEYLWGKNGHGALSGSDANVKAWYLQPAYKFGDFEVLVRYSNVDTDGRGIDIGQGTKYAPSAVPMDKMTEWYYGGNWYIRGNDLKLQAGYIHAETTGSLTGAGADKAKSDGLRTQLQLNF